MQYLLFVIFVLFLIYDFKKGVVVYAPFKFFFYEGFQLGFVSFDIAFSVLVNLLFIIRYRRLSKNVIFPWKRSFVILFFSGIIFSFYPSFSVGELLRHILCIYGYGYILFCVLDNRGIIKTLIISISIFTLLLAGNGFIQLVTDSNILGDFHDSFYKGEFHDNSLIRFGNFSRIRSFCSHSISYGVECVVFFILFLYLFILYKREYFSKWYYLAMGLCLIGIISSGSRTPLIGLAIMIFPLIKSYNKISLKQKTIITIIVLAFLGLFGTYVMEMIGSIINPDSSSVEGSNAMGRLEQFVYSWHLVQNRLWLGYGNVDLMDMNNFDYSRLYGAESIWLVLLLQKGLIGVGAYIYFYYDVLKHLPKNKIILISFIIGWLFIDSATSLMGINMFLPIMIISLLYRLDSVPSLLKKSNYFIHDKSFYGKTKYYNTCL